MPNDKIPPPDPSANGLGLRDVGSTPPMNSVEMARQIAEWRAQARAPQPDATAEEKFAAIKEEYNALDRGIGLTEV